MHVLSDTYLLYMFTYYTFTYTYLLIPELQLDSISLNSSQRIVFSSIKSANSGKRFDFSVNSSTEQRAATQSFFNGLLLCFQCRYILFELFKFTLLLERHTAFFIQTHFRRLLFLNFCRFFFLLSLLSGFRILPVAILGVIAGEIVECLPDR